MKSLKNAIIVLAATSAQVFAANIEIKPWLLQGDTQKVERISIDGEIIAGDSQRLVALAKENPERFAAAALAGVVLNSPGGNVDEAIKISDLLKASLATTMAFSPYKCLSACFYIYAGSAIRYGTPDTIGVHRPFLPKDAMTSISPAKAEEFTTNKYNELGRWLAKNNIPQDIIEKSLQRSSQEMYWLGNEDLAKIGARAPWYEEWLIARCPDYPRSEKLFIQNPTPENKAKLEKSAVCGREADRQYRNSSIAKIVGDKKKAK